MHPNGVVHHSPGLPRAGRRPAGLPWVRDHTPPFYPAGVASVAPPRPKRRIPFRESSATPQMSQGNAATLGSGTWPPWVRRARRLPAARAGQEASGGEGSLARGFAVWAFGATFTL